MAVDLRRREDDSSDLREKLCDSKKQIQQVQKEVRTPCFKRLYRLGQNVSEFILNLTAVDLC